MPANWGTFTSGMSSYLASNSAPNEAAFAATFEQLYISSLIGAQTMVGIPIIPPALPTPPALGLIASSLLADLNIAKQMKSGTLTPTAFITTANAIVTLTRLYAPPPHVTIFAGEPNSLSASITAAMMTQNSALVASMLATAFATHLGTVTGTITLGTVTTPWVGIF